MKNMELNYINLDNLNYEKPDDTVSIIVPCWNYLDHTKDCLGSISKFLDVPFEVIVVNNNSTDGTKEYLDLEAKKLLQINPLYRNYVAIHNDENKYLAGAINIGVKNSTSDFISIVANDIIIPRDMYAFLIDKLKKDSKIGAIGPWFTENPKAQNMFSTNKLDSVIQYLDVMNNKESEIKNSWHFSVCHIMRREAWNHIGPWDHNLKTHCNDNDWGIRLEMTGYKAVTYKKFVCYHHYGSLGRKQIPQENLVAKKDTEYFFKKWGIHSHEDHNKIPDPIKQIARKGNYLEPYNSTNNV